MKGILNKGFQALFDAGIGAAVYFILSAFFTNANSNTIVMIALVVSAIFAETVEFRVKK